MVEQLNGMEFREESEDLQNRESSIKEIILRQIKKIGDICSKEFTGGYWQKRPMKTSGGVMFTEEYHEDVREAYCVAVDFVVDLTYPYADSDLKKVIDEEENKNHEDVKEKLKSRRRIFRELNIFFEKEDFFNVSEYSDE